MPVCSTFRVSDDVLLIRRSIGAGVSLWSSPLIKNAIAIIVVLHNHVILWKKGNRNLENGLFYSNKNEKGLMAIEIDKCKESEDFCN